MAFRWRADDGQSLNAGLGSFVIFQGIRTSIAKKPYIFVIFQGGGGAEPLSLLWTRACSCHDGHFENCLVDQAEVVCGINWADQEGEQGVQTPPRPKNHINIVFYQYWSKTPENRSQHSMLGAASSPRKRNAI